MKKLTSDSHQMFYFYSEDGVRLGIKSREQVHHDGSWHRGVQLNLVNRGRLLLQRRSDNVDIAKGLFDQSLATQLIVEDNENDILALKRGLLTELGINIEELDIKHVAGPRQVVKTYDYDPTLYNREFVTLYQAELPMAQIFPKGLKVAELSWVAIPEIKKIATSNPDQFTKTFIMWLKEVM